MNAEFATAEEDLRAALAAADVLGSGHYRALALRHLAQGLAWHRPEEARARGWPANERNWELEAAHAEIGALTEAVKAQAIELAVIRGKSGWG